MHLPMQARPRSPAHRPAGAAPQPALTPARRLAVRFMLLGAALEVVAAAVGETALGHFLTVKRGELVTYETHVHPWERETYLEIV